MAGSGSPAGWIRTAATCRRRTGGARPQLFDFIQNCAEPRVQLVGSADTLAYAELFLTVRWLLQPKKYDPRLLLREAQPPDCGRGLRSRENLGSMRSALLS